MCLYGCFCTGVHTWVQVPVEARRGCSISGAAVISGCMLCYKFWASADITGVGLTREMHKAPVWDVLGRQLSLLHTQTGSGHFPFHRQNCHLALLCKLRGTLTHIPWAAAEAIASFHLSGPVYWTQAAACLAQDRTESNSVRLGETSCPRASPNIPLTKHFLKQTTCITQEVAHDIF